MDILLIPGLWLDESCFAQVVPVLEAAGHRARPLTLPGMHAGSDRAPVSLEDCVAAVAAAVDAAAGPVLLVGHSAGASLALAAADARPGRVTGLVYIGGFPVAAGTPVAAGFDVAGGEIALPEWSQFDEAELRGLDAAALAAFRARAVPSPGRLSTDPVRFTDERRHDIPVTVICPEFTSADLRQWLSEGEPVLAELARARDLRLVDLPTGHWPQFTRPAELGQAIVAAAAG